MKITLFIRNNNNSYPETCDIASVKITKNNKVFYFGSHWGEHDPTDSIESAVFDLDKEELDSYNWLKNLGYDVETTNEV